LTVTGVQTCALPISPTREQLLAPVRPHEHLAVTGELLVQLVAPPDRLDARQDDVPLVQQVLPEVRVVRRAGEARRGAPAAGDPEIGRASCRERVWMA